MLIFVNFSGSVASKIMAKMGYRQGSGLGRDEQGMSRALQVEKTSRRGGKILHEKDIASKGYFYAIRFFRAIYSLCEMGGFTYLP